MPWTWGRLASSRVPAVPVHSCSSLLQRLMKATADYCWRLFWVSLESLPLELVCSLWLAYIVASNISQDLQVSKTMLPQSLIRLHAEVFEDGLPCRHCLHGSCCSLLFCCDLRHLAKFMASTNRLLWLYPVKGHRLCCSGCSFPVSASCILRSFASQWRYSKTLLCSAVLRTAFRRVAGKITKGTLNVAKLAIFWTGVFIAARFILESN